MPSLFRQIHDRLAAVVGTDPELRPAGRPEFGHYQANVALRLANQQGRRPRDVAAEIVAAVDLSDLCEPLAIAGPGFINLRLRPEALLATAVAQLADPAAGIDRVARPQRVVVDYSAPNVAKPMHVGNLRSTIIGDCLVRVLRARGHEVIPQNHIGDWGTQFGMLVEQILVEGTDVTTLDLDSSVALYRRAQEHFREDPVFAEAARQRVVALQSGEPETRAIWQTLIEVSKAGFNRAYRRLGVLLTDDDLAGESMYNDLLPAVADDLEKAGIAVWDQGALVVFVEGDPTPLIVRKSDGGFGYAATDLAAVRHRVDRLRAERLIYVVGAPQAHHFQQVFAVARRAGWLPDGVTAEHVGFGSVLGPDGKMFKTRDGQTVSLDTLLDEAEQVAAPAVAMAAVKYADLSNSLHKDYVFDVDRMTALTGDTGPYLQYAHARAHQILRRAQAEGDDAASCDPDAGVVSAATEPAPGVVSAATGRDSAVVDAAIEPTPGVVSAATEPTPGVVSAGTNPDPVTASAGTEVRAAVAGVTESDWSAVTPGDALPPGVLREPAEMALLLALSRFPDVVAEVERTLQPHRLTTYLYELATAMSGFYEQCQVLKSSGPVRASRLVFCQAVQHVLGAGLDLLGIVAPERM